MSKHVVCFVSACETDASKMGVEEPFSSKIVECRKKFAAGQVACCSEDDEDAGISVLAGGRHLFLGDFLLRGSYFIPWYDNLTICKKGNLWEEGDSKKLHFYCIVGKFHAQVVKLVDTPDLGSGAVRCVGSSPILGNNVTVDDDICLSFRALCCTHFFSKYISSRAFAVKVDCPRVHWTTQYSP